MTDLMANSPFLLEERIRAYWDRRASAFGELREAEIESVRRARWLAEFDALLPARSLRILDIGTGTGFFAVLLSSMGHDVLGVDLSPKMIEEARRFAARHAAVHARFEVMDAMALPFAAESFDAIVTRNLTWTLPDVREAYALWQRLLVPGGLLINFDANYGPVSFCACTKELKEQGVENSHRDITDAELLECDAIKAALSVSHETRPAFDVALLTQLGFEDVRADETLSERIYPDQDETWNPIRMFSLLARKAP